MRNLRSRSLFLPLWLLLAGCEHAETHDETATISEPVNVVVVDVGSGDVELFGADVSEVRLLARIEGPSNHLAYEVADGRLQVFDECHESHCSVDVSAVVPAGVRVELRTGSGDIEVQDLLGAIELDTGSGDIHGFDLAGVDVSAETGSGDVVLDVFDPLERLHVRTGSGDVALDVPAGGYRLDVHTGSGDRDLGGVKSDSGAAASIEVDTGSGDVVIRGR